jgi:hypothetical protein
MSSMNFNVLSDNFNGNMEEPEKKAVEKEDKIDELEDDDDEKRKILDDDFLCDLKAVDVPDSDEECYF